MKPDARSDVCLILVDNTNLLVGGQHLSADQQGSATGPDRTWRLDFNALLRWLAQGRQVHQAIMVGSHHGGRDPGWAVAARAAGFTVVVHETNRRGDEKAVDTELVARGTEAITTAPFPMVMVLASGDRDFVPLVDVARRHGFTIELCAFKESFTRSGELARRADHVRHLDGAFELVGKG